MYSREEFAARRAKAHSLKQGLGRLTAAVAVVLGVGQLALIKATSGRVVAERAKPFELAMFIAYITVVGFLVWRTDREVTKTRPSCPQCRKPLSGDAADAVLMSGQCPRCGGRVLVP
mgnify:CR=1 FL=1